MKTQRFEFNRFGLASDPRGAQVSLDHQGRTMLGDVIGAYRDPLGVTLLRVRHFNGEPWPFDPSALAVTVLRP